MFGKKKKGGSGDAPTPKPKRKLLAAPIKTWQLMVGLFVFVVVWQCIFMWLWTTYPVLDTFLLRFSLSNSDSVCVYSIFVAFLAYYLYEKSGESEDMAALRKFCKMIKPFVEELDKEMDKKGVTPEEVALVIHNMMQYEKDFKKWMERMEKLMPVFDALAETAGSLDQKSVGILLGKKIGEYMQIESAPVEPIPEDTVKIIIKALDKSGYKIVKKEGRK